MISRLKRMSRGGWITCGIVLGAIIAPGVALAAFSDVRIVGPGGTTAVQVTPANQLWVAEINPSRLRRVSLGVFTGSGCVTFNAPAGSSFMLREAVIDVSSNPTPSPQAGVYLYADKNCPSSRYLGSVTPAGTGTTVIPFEPGIAIKSGGGFSVQVGGPDIAASVLLLGYTMPAGAVPATTSTVRKGSFRRR